MISGARQHAPTTLPIPFSARLRMGRAAWVTLLVSFTAMLFATAALAQQGGPLGNAPPPPPGPGNLKVQLVERIAEGSLSLEGIPIALYALAPDGTPGLAQGETDATGSYVFSNLSNDPSIVYLVGARVAEIPFGERVAFTEGTTHAVIEIAVSPPTNIISGVEIKEIRARIDWLGDRILVREILKIESTGDQVIRLTSTEEGMPPKGEIFLRPLPESASNFDSGANSIGDGLALETGGVRFWGPLYPGEQRVEYQYTLPLPPSSAATAEASGENSAATTRSEMDFPVELREGAGRFVVVAGTEGMEISGPGLIEARAVASDAGTPLNAWATDRLRPGRPFSARVTLPENRFDASALSMPQGNVWLDLDDTRMNANVDLSLSVTPGPPVAGTPDAPLLRITVPDGAALEGVTPDTEKMGLIPNAIGGFDLIGPIAPGEHSVAYSFKMPSNPAGVDLDLRFPREVATLNVLIADTGLALDSRRLHRRRPFRNRTRNYLHREAYNVAPDEGVDLRLAPLSAEGLPQNASIGLIAAAVIAAALFLMAPLRAAARRTQARDPELERLQDEREAVYAAIADLDHDFETGKLDPADYEEMRASLREEAIHLMRAEHGEREARREPTAASSAPAASDAVTLTAAVPRPGTDTPHDDSAAPPAPSPSRPHTTHAPPAPTSLGQAAAASSPASLGSSLAGRADAPAATSPTPHRFCPECGGSIDPGWRFCSHCGAGLPPAAATEVAD